MNVIEYVWLENGEYKFTSKVVDWPFSENYLPYGDELICYNFEDKRIKEIFLDPIREGGCVIAFCECNENKCNVEQSKREDIKFLLEGITESIGKRKNVEVLEDIFQAMIYMSPTGVERMSQDTEWITISLNTEAHPNFVDIAKYVILRIAEIHELDVNLG